MSLRKTFLALGLLLLVGVWGACVDVPSGPVTNISPDFRSQARFVHSIPGGAAGDVKIDGASVGSAAFGTPLGYVNVASGSRSVAFGSAAAQNLSFGSEQQSTMLIYQSSAVGAVSYLNLLEGHKDKNNGKAGVAKVKFVNAAWDCGSVTFRVDSATGTVLSTAAFATAPQYVELAPGTRTVYAIADSGTPKYQSIIAASAYEDGKMYTIVVAGKGATFQAMKMEDRRP